MYARRWRRGEEGHSGSSSTIPKKRIEIGPGNGPFLFDCLAAVSTVTIWKCGTFAGRDRWRRAIRQPQRVFTRRRTRRRQRPVRRHPGPTTLTGSSPSGFGPDHPHYAEARVALWHHVARVPVGPGGRDGAERGAIGADESEREHAADQAAALGHTLLVVGLARRLVFPA